MAAVSLSSVPEALLTVAEKTLDTQPLFLGLSGSQLSRLAREVYVHLKKNGKEALAEQAQLLTDPSAIARALQVLQTQQPQQPQQQQQGRTAGAATCPCCMHQGGCGGTHGPQPQTVPIVLLQPPQQWPMQQQLQQWPYLQHEQPQHYIRQQQKQPQEQHVTEGQHNAATSQQPPMEWKQQQPHRQQQQQESEQQQRQLQGLEQHAQQQQEQQHGTSRKACVARLLFAVIAAKIAKDILLSRQSSGSSSKKPAVEAAPATTGLGSVSLEGLAESLTPRRGLFAGLQRDVLQSLQRVVAAAIDGSTAAMSAAGYGANKDASQGGPQEMPPLYLSPAQQGRVELTEHEKHASELIEKLLKMGRGRSLESLRLEAGKKTDTKQEQKQELDQGQKEGISQEQQHFQKQQENMDKQMQQLEEHNKKQKPSEEDALDAEFKAFLRRAEQHKGPNPLTIEQQLRFYGLFKRATSGKCTEKQPSRFNLRQYKKWEAWKACDGMSALEAKREYVQMARKLDKLHSRL